MVTVISLSAFAQKGTATTTPPPAATEAPVAPAPVKKVANTSSTGRPSNPFEVGVSGGLHAIWGDVYSNVKPDLDNSTVGIHIRKALSHSFSMRLQYFYGQATMRHNMPHYTAVVNGLTNNSANAVWFPSTQSFSHTLSWDQILTVGNSSLYKTNSKWIFDLFAGPALVGYRTKIDYKNSNGAVHNFAQAENIYNSFSNPGGVNIGDNKAKNEAGKYLDGILDGDYETLASNNRARNVVGGYVLAPAITFGAAISYALSDRFNLSLEQRGYYLFDDYIDGERWSNFTSVPQYSQMNDFITNTTVKLNANIGKKGEKPLYWRNANEEVQKKLASMNPKKAINEALMDDDGDGVPNIMDQEPASREGCSVDTRGIMLDSDKDGILDCDDKEPFSPAGYTIDNNGVAIVPPPACCKEIENMKKAVTAAAEPKVSNNVSAECAESSLPTIKFEKAKYGINSSMIGSLKTIGDKMQNCPDMKLVVNGINDKNTNNGKLNEQLSYNRAMEITNYLSEKFGISRDRFIVRYNLEGVGDTDADRAVMFRNGQVGESGASNPPSPHPGLKAGSK